MLGDILSQIIPDLIGIPTGAGNEVLEIRGRFFSEFFGELPTVFSFDSPDQPLNIIASMSFQFFSRKAGLDPFDDRLKFPTPGFRFSFGDH